MSRYRNKKSSLHIISRFYKTIEIVGYNRILKLSAPFTQCVYTSSNDKIQYISKSTYYLSSRFGYTYGIKSTSTVLSAIYPTLCHLISGLFILGLALDSFLTSSWIFGGIGKSDTSKISLMPNTYIKRQGSEVTESHGKKYSWAGYIITSRLSGTLGWHLLFEKLVIKFLK